MREKLKTYWLLHLLIVTLFSVTDGYVYYTLFSDKATDAVQLTILKIAMVLAALIFTHSVWLLVFFIRLLINRQYALAIVPVIFVLINTALLVVTGYVFPVIMAMAPG